MHGACVVTKTKLNKQCCINDNSGAYEDRLHTIQSSHTKKRQIPYLAPHELDESTAWMLTAGLTPPSATGRGTSVPLQRGGQTECNLWTRLLLKVLRLNRSSCILLATAPCFSNFCFVFPSFITHQYPLSIPLFTLQWAENAWLFDLFQHKNHYISPSHFYLHPPIQSIQLSFQWNVQRFHIYLFTLTLGLFWETLCLCGLKQTEREKKL